MIRTYRNNIDDTCFDLTHHENGLFAICDFLGFSEFILQKEVVEGYDWVINNMLEVMEKYKKLKINEILESVPDRGVFGEDWLKNLSLSYKINSDSFIVYPVVIEIKTKEQYGFLLTIMKGLLEKIYTHILALNEDVMLRGVLMHGEYGYTEDFDVIMGRGIINAYRYEQMQNWSGILIHPFYHELYNNYGSNQHIGVEYSDIPLKNNLTSVKYRQELTKKSLKPYVLNWVNLYRKYEGDIPEDFWYNKIDRVLESNSENKHSAIDKILNTKKFYDYVIEHYELG